ncbi:MAG: segregation/condensation protein A [Terracidiphilus sp.]|jgi:segregation and condensation protein A
MQEKVPWWRRALEFTLGGIRSGFGLFRHNGRVETGKESSAAGDCAGPETAAGEPEEAKKLEAPKEESALKQTSPQSEEAADETKQAAEAVSSGGEVPTAQEAVEEAAEAAKEPQQPAAAEELASSTPQAEPAPAADAAKEPQQPAAEAIEPEPCAEERVVEAAKANDPSDSAEHIEVQAQAAPEENAAVNAEELPAAAAEPAAPTPEAEPAPAAEAAKEKEAAPPQEAAAALPFDAKPAVEPTTAEKVAAALKARGQDAEQSPFSVLVGQVYDGPLDLLLDLIRKQDIDIYDIPIAKITAQFLAYVNRLRASDMDVAGEFIYTAALLIHIKSKMLLPRAPAGPEEPGEDPRRELVERLLEHERFRNAAQMLHEKQMLESATWTNPGVREFREDTGAEPEMAADTTDLVRIFRDILERARNRPILDLEEDTVTVSQMMEFLARRLTMEDRPVALRRLLSHTRSERALIAMFLALLELVRLQAILLRQDRHFSEIFIKKNTGFEAVMNEGLANARDDWR